MQSPNAYFQPANNSFHNRSLCMLLLQFVLAHIAISFAIIFIVSLFPLEHAASIAHTHTHAHKIRLAMWRSCIRIPGDRYIKHIFSKRLSLFFTPRKKCILFNIPLCLKRSKNYLPTKLTRPNFSVLQQIKLRFMGVFKFPFYFRTLESIRF